MAIDNQVTTQKQIWKIGLESNAHEEPSGKPIRKRYLYFKTVFDFVLALILFVLAIPFILVAGILIKLTSRGPIIYSQIRIGRFGKPYTIYKLRTMTHNCELISGAQWSKPGDSRITFIGGILRKTHIDELPQLWNVIRGDMSLVGPRPERPEFVQKLEKQIPNYKYRLLVKPGITGLAQVQLPPDIDLPGVRRKTAYDLYYVRRLSFGLDLRLLICTGLLFVGIPTSFSRWLLFVPGSSVIEKSTPEIPTEFQPV